MVNVRGDNCATAGNLIANEFRRDPLWQRRTKALAAVLPRNQRPLFFGQTVQKTFAQVIFSDRDEFHFGCDNAASRVVHLGDILAGARSSRVAPQFEPHLLQLRIFKACSAVSGGGTGQVFRVNAPFDPVAAQRRQPCTNVDAAFRVGIGPRSVVNEDRWIFFLTE